MDYIVEKTGSSVTVSISGRLSIDDQEKFHQLLSDLFLEKMPTYVIDVSGVDFVDSGGLSMFLLARERARSLDSTMAIKGAHGAVLSSINVAGLDALIDII